MTNEYSYEKNSCSQYLKELCALYRDRGVSAHVNEDALAQERNEAKTRNIAPNAYHMSYMMDSAVGERYRNGNYNGQKYMTSDDFVAYFNKSRHYQISSSDAVQQVKDTAEERQRVTASNSRQPVTSAARPATNGARRAAPARVRTTAGQVSGSRTVAPRPTTPEARRNVPTQTTVVGNGNRVRATERTKMGDKAVVVKTKSEGLARKVSAFASEWFPMELRESRTTTERRRMPLGAMATLATVSISLMLIVGSNVMVSRASAEVSRLKEEESKLRDTQTELCEVLEEKNDPDLIRDLAIQEYGMVNRDYISVTYMDRAVEDEVIHYGDEVPDLGISALLSAIASGQ